MADDKVIVTNVNALKNKYGTAGWTAIRSAIRSLVVADKKRGVTTKLVAIDDATTMKKLKVPPVTAVSNCQQNKVAIDAVFTAFDPDYLMILGATDVIPHQDIKNPAFAAGDDDDPVAYGDLPYSCNVAYSRLASKYIGPTRVVSRLPDLRGAKTPSHLLALLKYAAKATPRPAAEFESGFALSAEVWRASTELSISNIFGTTVKTRLCPSEGPQFAANIIGASVHFINCHGSPADPTFYGQHGTKFPPALKTQSTTGKITPGTLIAAECCYGAELYDAETLSIPIPICQSYLAQGALAYLGSTTIAYGPAEGNGSADLLTQFFIIQLLAGASVGRAALVARQEFVAQTGQMDAIDLKTLAQFCVYGDPSVHPVSIPSATQHVKSARNGYVETLARRERRAKLVQSGEQLLRTKPIASRVTKAKIAPTTRKALDNIARKAGITHDGFVAYAVESKHAPRKGSKLKTQPDRYHVLIRPVDKSPIAQNRVAVVAKETGNRIIGYRIYYSH